MRRILSVMDSKRLVDNKAADSDSSSDDDKDDDGDDMDEANEGTLNLIPL